MQKLPAKTLSPSVKQNMAPGIRARMRELKIRVPDLAEKIDVPATTLYNILGGRSEPALLLAVKIAWGLQWTLEKFVSEFYTSERLAGITEFCRIGSADGEKPCGYSPYVAGN